MGRPKLEESTKKGKKRRKDVNRPKRATSAYFYFMAYCRQTANRNGQTISKVSEFTKECSAKWRKMNPEDKSPFEQQAAKDKDRYVREIAQYKGKTIEPNKPKRPQSSYFLFLSDFRTQMKDAGVDHREILRLAGERWRSLTNEQKKPYEKRSAEETKKYERAMEEYRRTGGAAGVSQKPPMKKPKTENKNGRDEDDEEDEEEEGDEQEEEEEEDEEEEEEEEDE